MKVLLTAVNSKYIHSNLAVRYLRAYTQDLDFQCTIREFSINDRIENILKEIICEKPDIVAFSCYIWNMEYVNRLAELIKLVDNKIEILFGGPEVSFDSKEYLEKHVGDFVIEGEGEETFREFIIAKLENKEVKKIRGLYTKDGSEVYFGGVRPQMDMKKLVFPYSNDDKIDEKIVYYEASRGCPFKCKYCLSSATQGVRFLPVERVKEELKFFMKKGVRLVKFVDRTFNCDHKFAKEIWSYLMEQDTNTTFHFEISADILREDEIKLLNCAPKNRFQFEVGVQTTNNEVLNNINRYVGFEVLKPKVEAISSGKNIMQHLDLIAGLPGEDFNSFKKSFNDVYSIRPDEIQLGFLKLLKGSAMREEAEKWGIVYSPYAPYEILRSKDISYDELLVLKKIEEMVDKYNNSGKFKTIIDFFENKFETPFDFFYELAMFFDKLGYFSRNINNADYYGVFIEFNNVRLNGEEDILLRELIKYEYLKFNKKKWLPSFLIRDIEKSEEKKIRQSLREEFDFNKYHLEKFKIDINEYINKKYKKYIECYLLFENENSMNVIDVTERINNIRS